MVNNRSIPQNRSLSSPQIASNNSPLTPNSTPSRVAPERGVGNEAPKATTPPTEVAGELYGKLKTCQANIEKINIDPDVLRQWFVGDCQKSLKMRGVCTVGELCSLSSSDISSLPFKMPKLENFMEFIKKFEELKESEQEITTMVVKDTKLTKLGSVEEEMDKLETSNVLNTSIEAETETKIEEPRLTRRSSTRRSTAEVQQEVPKETEKDVTETAQTENVQMDVDMEAKKESTSNESLVKPGEMDNMISNMNSYINNEASSSFKVETNLSVRNVMSLLEQADNIESEILKDFQQKLFRLAVTRKNLRNHAESLIN